VGEGFGTHDEHEVGVHAHEPLAHDAHLRPWHRLLPAGLAEAVWAASMTLGRGAAARVVADVAVVGAADRVVDVGCGPGTAARVAARRGARATGVDPSPAMLGLARWITTLARTSGVAFLEGGAESLPLESGTATIVWALASEHHWRDRAAGLTEARRVLVPGGRVLIAERAVTPGATGHARHGLTDAQAGELAHAMTRAGFAGVTCVRRRARRRNLVIVSARSTGR